MSVVSSFPLFNLPLLAINKVIINMIPIEQIYFSLISKKCKELVKRKHILDLEINGLYGSMIQIVCKNQYGSTFSNEIMDKRLEYQCSDLKLRKLDDWMTTLWENKVEGIQKVMSLLFNLFRIQKLYFNLQPIQSEDVFKIITQFQKLRLEFKTNVSKIEIVACSLNNHIFRYILENFKDVPEVFVNTRRAIFQHNIVQPESYCTISDVELSASEMLNLSITYKSIKLCRLHLTTKEVNKFLRKWMESSTMENVELTVGNMDYRKAMERLPATPQNKLLSLGGMRPQPTECYEIQRNDGVKANLWNNYGDFAMQTYQ